MLNCTKKLRLNYYFVLLNYNYIFRIILNEAIIATLSFKMILNYLSVQ